MDMSHVKRYMKERLIDQINWYNKKSSKYKKEYYLWQSISIIAAAAIPVLAGLTSIFHFVVLIISILGALTGAIQSILSLTKVRSNWLMYRFISEDLKTEKIKFDNQCAPYSKESLSSNFKLLVDKCENIMNSEHEKWFNKDTRKQG